MTALNWVLLDKLVVIAMDSMAHHIAEGEFRIQGFWTKLFPLPHLKGVMVTTGLMQIGLDWFRVIQENLLAQDLLFVDRLAPEQLRAIAAKYADEYTGTTTVYDFGVDPVRKKMLGLAYRSTNQFASERLPFGFALKPGDREAFLRVEGLVNAHGPFAGLSEVMQIQKTNDDALPPGERVGIGGEIHMLSVDTSAATMHLDRAPVRGLQRGVRGRARTAASGKASRRTRSCQRTEFGQRRAGGVRVHDAEMVSDTRNTFLRSA